MSRLVLVHLSDTHFGDRIDPDFGIIRGFWPHDLDTCLAFQEAVDDALLDLDLGLEADVLVVHSGDLSKVGAADELRLGRRYLADRTLVPGSLDPTETFGLGTPHARVLVVPGNHDHWDGLDHTVPRRLYNPALFPISMDAVPWSPPRAFTTSDGELTLVVLGLDSLAGFQGSTPPAGSFDAAMQRAFLRAEGRLDTGDLATLARQVAPAGAAAGGRAPAKALVLHHPLHGAPLLHGIPQDERNELLDACQALGIGVLLTGHVHTVTPPVRLRRDPDVWQIVCGTTTQGRPRPNRHGFWIHVVSAAGARTRWEAFPFRWSRARRRFYRAPRRTGLDALVT